MRVVNDEDYDPIADGIEPLFALEGCQADGSQFAGATGRVCDWCRGPIPERARRDSVCCSKRCRQARHRARVAVGLAGATPVVAGGQPRHLAYADPPYPGKASTYYRGHVDFAGEVDHAELITWLSAEHDAWALSTSAEALQQVLALCPTGVRVAAWHRGFRPNKAAMAPLSAWEPVIYAGQILTRREDPHDASCLDRETRRAALERHVAGDVGTDPSRCAAADPSRPPGERVAEDLSDASEISTRRVDSLVYRAAPTTTNPDRVTGAKSPTFCSWVFGLLAATAADTFVDVFPGSGAVARAWLDFTGTPAVLGDRSW